LSTCCFTSSNCGFILFAAECKVLHLSVTLYVTLMLGSLNFICQCSYVVIEVSELCPFVLLFILTSIDFFLCCLACRFLYVTPIVFAISSTFFHSSSFTSGVMDS
jgi:hypothetical protein